jgi:CheY-like chemotaxis protein
MSAPPVVLHVEDDPNDRLLLSIVFKKVGGDAVLRSASDGQEAVDYLSGRGAYEDRAAHPRPHVVLLDLKLPRVSGFELLAWARSRPELENLPMLVLTSSQEQSDILRAYDLGARSYLVKSVDLGEMREIVRGVVALARLLTGPKC